MGKGKANNSNKTALQRTPAIRKESKVSDAHKSGIISNPVKGLSLTLYPVSTQCSSRLNSTSSPVLK